MALTHKLVYTFIFTTNHFRVLDAQRERERERRESYRSTQNRSHPSTSVASTQHWRRHISLTTTKIASPPKTDPPKLIHRRSHHPIPIHRRSHHPRPIAPHRDRITVEDRSTRNQYHWHRRYPWPISLPFHRYPWLILSPSRSHLDLVITHDRSSLNLVTHDRSRHLWPMTDLSLSLHFLSLSLPPFLSLTEWCCFDFCFFKFIYWNFLL